MKTSAQRFIHSKCVSTTRQATHARQCKGSIGMRQPPSTL